MGDGAPAAGLLRAWRVAPRPAYAVAWWRPDAADTASRRFVVRFQRLTGAPAAASDAMNYDALMVAAQAVREVGPHPRAIRRWLSGLGTVRPPYRGVTGPISFAAVRPVNLIMMRLADSLAAPAGRARE